MRSDENFQNYYQTIVKKVAGYPQNEQPSLPRKCKRAGWSILQYRVGRQSAGGHHPRTVEDHYMSIYYEAVDAVVQTIMTPSDQPIFKAQCILEQLLIKGIQSQDITIEISEVKSIYSDDINFDSLPNRISIVENDC